MARRGIRLDPGEILKPQDLLRLTAAEKRDAEKWEARRREAYLAKIMAESDRAADGIRQMELARGLPGNWPNLPSLEEIEAKLAVAKLAILETEKALRQFVMLAESRRQTKVDN